MGARYAIQRSNRVRLKADMHAMLLKLGKQGLTLGEINEMLVRLKPPTGAAAPIVLTGYTAHGKIKGFAPVEPPIDWKAEGLFDPIGGTFGMRYRKPVDGMDERFGFASDAVPED